MDAPMKFYDFLIDPLLGALGALSFRTWHIVARLLDGDAALLGPDDLAIAQRITGRSRFPTQSVSRFFASLGRRSGKTLFESRRAAWFLSQDYRDRLASGETAVVAAICPTTDQAKRLLAYTRACFVDSPVLAPMMGRDVADGFELSHSSAFEVAAASFRSSRGRTFSAVLMDEASWLRNADAAIPDREIARAVEPGLATLDGSLEVFSSPYMRAGLLWDANRRFFGNDGAAELFVTGPTRLFNPCIRESIIAAAFEDDPESARAEWGGEFRTDLSAAFDPAWIDAALDGSVFERAPVTNLPQGRSVAYVAFTDPAGGSGKDSWSTRIVHADGMALYDDAVLEIRPPFNTADAARQIAEFLRRYRITETHGDRYAGAWPGDALRAHGISYLESERTKSDIYREAVPLFSARRVRLLDHARTSTQLRQLERRTRPGGKDSIDHPVGSSDDNANCLCGALVVAARDSLTTGDQMIVLPSAINADFSVPDVSHRLDHAVEAILTGQRWR